MVPTFIIYYHISSGGWQCWQSSAALIYLSWNHHPVLQLSIYNYDFIIDHLFYSWHFLNQKSSKQKKKKGKKSVFHLFLNLFYCKHLLLTPINLSTKDNYKVFYFRATGSEKWVIQQALWVLNNKMTAEQRVTWNIKEMKDTVMTAYELIMREWIPCMLEVFALSKSVLGVVLCCMPSEPLGWPAPSDNKCPFVLHQTAFTHC